jgi:hypothetical protein
MRIGDDDWSDGIQMTCVDMRGRFEDEDGAVLLLECAEYVGGGLRISERKLRAKDEYENMRAWC